MIAATDSGVPFEGWPYGWPGNAVAHQRRFAISFGLVVPRLKFASIWLRTSSTGSASKRGEVSARRNSSTAESRLAVSERKEPRK